MKDLLKYNGTITLLSKTTGGHRTFRIKTQKDSAKWMPGRRIISLLTGPNNKYDYTPFAFIKKGRVQVFQDKKTPVYLKYAEMLGEFHKFEKNYDVMQEAKCRRCNAPLTTPESIEKGIGPKCGENE